ELERRFAELRAGDRRSIPPFDAVVRRARPRRSRAPLLAAALLGIALGAGIVLPRPRGGQRGAVGIATWESPTASLLTFPGSDLLRHVPSISESVIHLEE